MRSPISAHYASKARNFDILFGLQVMVHRLKLPSK